MTIPSCLVWAVPRLQHGPCFSDDEEGYEILGEALAKHENITELDLSKNFFKGDRSVFPGQLVMSCSW